jgi:uncharacterized protein YjiS (DUF1127 family)
MFIAFARPLARTVDRAWASRTPCISLLSLEKWLTRRRQRKALRELAEHDEHLLRDIGLSRAEALREAAKPCWRA